MEGKPGEYPAWLIGSMFYLSDKLLFNEKGDFDKLKARKKIAENYSLVFGLDVVFPSFESIDKILLYVSEYDAPIDSPVPRVRARSHTASRKLGIRDRVIANGIFIDSPEEEVNSWK